MGKKKAQARINTSASSEALANPFASLSTEGLPEGPEILPVIEDSEAQKSIPAKKGRVVLRRETAHRGGKTVVVAGDFEPGISLEEIEEMSRELRKFCGCGGTVREREIEVQGDQPSRVSEYFRAKGFRVAGVTG